MTKLTNVSKIVMVAVIAVVVIVLVIVYNNSAGVTGPGNNSSSSLPNATLTAASPTQTQNTTTSAPTTGGQVATAPRPPAPVIHMITPVTKDIWKIGTQNVISWNKPGGITGSISLINAATKAFMGIVLPQIGPNQTSYTWNTRDLLLDRTNPLKKDVATGTYLLKLSFDGNNMPPVMSPSFTITN